MPVVRDSGQCLDGGLARIVSLSECFAAAQALLDSANRDIPFEFSAYSDLATGCAFFPKSLRVFLNTLSTQVNCSSSRSCLCSAGIRPTCDVQDGSAPHTSSSNGCACPFLAGSTSAYCKTGQYCYGGMCRRTHCFADLVDVDSWQV